MTERPLVNYLQHLCITLIQVSDPAILRHIPSPSYPPSVYVHLADKLCACVSVGMCACPCHRYVFLNVEQLSRPMWSISVEQN